MSKQAEKGGFRRAQEALGKRKGKSRAVPDTPVTDGRDPKTGKFLPKNTAALTHGRFRFKATGILPSDIQAEVTAFAAQLLADQGGSGDGVGAGSGGAQGSGDGLLDGVGARLGGAGDGGGGGGAVPPRPVEITWPDTRRLAHCVGLRIDVRIRVDAQGRVERVEPASQGVASECVRAALETAKQIKFTPGTVAGKPATMWTQVTIDFEKEK